MIPKVPPGIVGMVHGPPKACSQVQWGPSTVKPKEEKTGTPGWAWRSQPGWRRPTRGTTSPPKAVVERSVDNDKEDNVTEVNKEARATV